jgi:hypothetical protein
MSITDSPSFFCVYTEVFSALSKKASQVIIDSIAVAEAVIASNDRCNYDGLVYESYVR